MSAVEADASAVSALFSPRRLRLARETRMMTRTALAHASQVTPAAVSQFERGEARPVPQTLQRLASSLDFPVHFFAVSAVPSSRDEELGATSSEQGYFRSLRSITVRRDGGSAWSSWSGRRPCGPWPCGPWRCGVSWSRWQSSSRARRMPPPSSYHVRPDSSRLAEVIGRESLPTLRYGQTGAVSAAVLFMPLRLPRARPRRSRRGRSTFTPEPAGLPPGRETARWPRPASVPQPGK